MDRYDTYIMKTNSSPLIHEIFKVPVYSVKLSLDLTTYGGQGLSHIQALQLFCQEYKDNNESRIISNSGGYQSEDLDLDTPILKPLIDEIENHANQFAKGFIGTECCDNQVVDNMWININGHKDSNHSHNHPKSDISGVYYLAAPEKCGNLVFEHPAMSVLTYYGSGLNNPVTKYNDYNSSIWQVVPSINNLHLFPAWLNHCVLPNKNEKAERLSISFNTKDK